MNDLLKRFNDGSNEVEMRTVGFTAYGKAGQSQGMEKALFCKKVPVRIASGTESRMIAFAKKNGLVIA